jgi:hypothetical protein
MSDEVQAMLKRYPITSDLPKDALKTESARLRGSGFEDHHVEAMMDVFASERQRRLDELKFLPSYAEDESMPNQELLPDKANAAHPPGPRIEPPNVQEFNRKLVINRALAGHPAFARKGPYLQWRPDSGFNI